MKENVGRIDRIGRFIIAPTLMALGYTRFGGHRGRPLGLAAMIGATLILESAITRVCPFNRLLGLDTRSQRERARDLEALVGGEQELPFEAEEELGTVSTVVIG